MKQLVYSYLLAVLDNYNHHLKQQSILNRKIPLYKGRDNQKILYISDLALMLSKSHNRATTEVSNFIASHLWAISSEIFLVQIVSPGSIHITITDSLLAIWLQHLAIKGLGENELGVNHRRVKIVDSSRLFTIFHAHARCCSLILLAAREGLIEIEKQLPDNSELLGNLRLVNTIPWLNSHTKLRCHHPHEMRLISELVRVVDELMCSDSGVVNWEKLGLDLSQAFADFYRYCRIWGEVKTNFPELAQVRLGLVMVTQKVLRFLLETKLGVIAPWEL
ncbi:glutamate acetyltransferase [Nostoc sp. TCL26-01]|uniref:glutamate acetyltransferase n=1 Tax=Nostoc sp. TCL26-01 TaxID=2576904 RepID=UPI0021191707|nr:glutamate acetyltransferase [Nostoc sp. TCL26-01]